MRETNDDFQLVECEEKNEVRLNQRNPEKPSSKGTKIISKKNAIGALGPLTLGVLSRSCLAPIYCAKLSRSCLAPMVSEQGAG